MWLINPLKSIYNFFFRHTWKIRALDSKSTAEFIQRKREEIQKTLEIFEGEVPPPSALSHVVDWNTPKWNKKTHKFRRFNVKICCINCKREVWVVFGSRCYLSGYCGGCIQ